MYILKPNEFKKVNNSILKEEKTHEIILRVWETKSDGLISNMEKFYFLINHCHMVTYKMMKEIRGSLNCRFKSVFTPYRDKKLGEFWANNFKKSFRVSNQL